MPELPEVETTRAGLTDHLIGCRVDSLLVRQPALRWPIPAAMAEYFEEQEILNLSRRGKYLLLSSGVGTALIHLGMSGSLRISPIDEALRTHDHWQMSLGNGRLLRYHDPRRFGAFLWAGTKPLEHKLIVNLGPEPLGEGFTAEKIFSLSRGKTKAIKNFLMDSKTVVGVGNIYASESLFKAGIHPNRAAGKVSLDRYRLLVQEVRKVLAAAIESGGSTLRDYVNGSGAPGYFQQQLSVYGRKNQPCVQCKAPIRQITIGQRSSFYCGKCQR